MRTDRGLTISWRGSAHIALYGRENPMPEIGNPWVQGHPREEQLVSREIYNLLTIFASSETLQKRRKSQDGGCVYSWSIQCFEYAEIGRILVSLSAMLRNDWDAYPYRSEQNLTIIGQDPSVGILIPDLDDAATSTPLAVRESFNKILHSEKLHLDRSEGSDLTSGYLLPRVHLYGMHHGRRWKASIDIFRWAEAVHVLS